MEITMTITVSAETAVKIAELLSKSGKVNSTASPAVSAAPVQNAPQAITSPAQQYSAPVQTSSVTQFSVPVQQTTPIQQTAPTADPAYTLPQLQVACAPLMDAGKGAQLQQLVQSFGVVSLMELPPERYGEFANGVRSLGGVL